MRLLDLQRYAIGFINFVLSDGGKVKMTGVEILATQEVATAFGFGWENFWMGFAIVAFIGFFIGILISLSTGDFINIAVGVILGALLGILAGAGIGANSTPIEYETQYKVIISDEVSMNDFLERYEIVSQEGKIYTVRENNDEE